MATDVFEGTNILSPDVVQRKLRRMAFEIAEQNESETSLVVAGVEGNGTVLAQNLVQQLQQILDIDIQYVTIIINKKQPLNATLQPQLNWNNQNVLVVDDVANTGKTLLYALKPFLSFQPKKIQTLVLVERSHKLFSIQPDYVGLSLATTLQEHITVTAEGDTITGVWLH